MKYQDILETDTLTLRIMFCAYMTLGNFILLNLFISVINEGLAYMKENPGEVDFDEELADYLEVSSSVPVTLKGGLRSVWFSIEQSVMVSDIAYVFMGFVVHDWSWAAEFTNYGEPHWGIDNYRLILFIVLLVLKIG